MAVLFECKICGGEHKSPIAFNVDFNLTEVLGNAEKRTDFLKRIEYLISL